jgi:hypothetical protein
VNIPDYISPIVGYRVWHWDSAGLRSLNGEPWLPGRPLAAGCEAAARGTIVGRAEAAHSAHEPPHSDCTCGVYAAKNIEHLRQSGYERYGIHGEVYLWGTVVEHERGWRAQFGYPKSLFLPPDAIPFTLTEMDARLETLIAFGVDIFLVGDHENIRFWKSGSGFDAAGLDYLIKTRKQYYDRRRQERTLKKGDHVAILGRGIAVVERADDKEIQVLWNRLTLMIARKEIVWDECNMRWECEANNARGDNALRKPSLI